MVADVIEIVKLSAKSLIVHPTGFVHRRSPMSRFSFINARVLDTIYLDYTVKSDPQLIVLFPQILDLIFFHNHHVVYSCHYRDC